ncbi:hypothetical protein Scep_004329 [Stephania cephalantha]|uniref:Uncharacterized protein n=1 Tax=Stephania cephalantha TaxID=152367 RepID=A0AAP0KUT6_9MAGN
MTSYVPSTLSSETIPNRPSQSPSVASLRRGIPATMMPMPPATASPAASREGRAGLQVAGILELHPSRNCAWRMTKVFKWWMILEGYYWKSVPDHHKDHYWRKW